jgi:hypothetical protein
MAFEAMGRPFESDRAYEVGEPLLALRPLVPALAGGPSPSGWVAMPLDRHAGWVACPVGLHAGGAAMPQPRSPALTPRASLTPRAP